MVLPRMPASTGNRRIRGADAGIVLILFISGFALVGRAIAGRGILGLYPSDGTRLVYFVREFLQSSLADAKLPLWNPFSFFGTPFYANMQVATFYPLNLPLLAFPLDISYNLFIGLHLGMAGAFMYLLARSWLLGPLAGLVSGLAYMLNANFVGYGWGGDVNMLSAAVWLPLVLLLFDRALSSREHRVGWMLCASGAFGIEVLSGHPQYSFFTSFVLLIAALFRSWQLRRSGGKLASIVLPLGLWVGVLGTGALLAAAQLLPTFEAAQLSTRHFEWNFEWPRNAIEGSYNPIRLVTWVIPDLFGNSVSLRPALTDWLSMVLREIHSNEFRAYIGILPLALAIFSLSGWRTSPRIRFLAVLAGIALLMALGGLTPLYRIEYAFVPPLRTFRIPARFLCVVLFSGALLSGFGVQALADGARIRAKSWGRALIGIAVGMGLCLLIAVAFRNRILETGRRLAAPVFTTRPLGRTLTPAAREDLIAGAYHLATRASAVGALLVALSGVVFWWSSRSTKGKPRWTIAAVVLTAVDLSLQTLPYTSFTPLDDLLSQEASVVAAIEGTGASGRVLTLPAGIPAGGADLVHPGDNALMHYRLLGAGGFDSFELATYRAAVDSITVDLREGSSRLASSFGIRFIVTDLPLPRPDFRPLARIGPATVYENPQALPRFYLAPQALAVATPVEALARLSEGLPAGTVLLEGTEMGGQMVSGKEPNSIEVKLADRGHLILAVSASAPVMLVTNDTYYPGWVAKVDGALTPVSRANGLVRAVPLPSGTHIVEFRFSPRSLILGAWISLLTLAALVVVVVAISLQERKKRYAHRDAWPSPAQG